MKKTYWSGESEGFRGRMIPVLGFLIVVLLLFPSGMSFGTDRQIIVVGGNENFPPYEFLDRDGSSSGYNVELTRAIAKVMGMDVQIKLGPWPEMRRALIEGKIDILMGVGQSEDRSKTMEFSPPHTILNFSIFGRRDSPDVNSIKDLIGKKVVLMEGGLIHEVAVQQGLADTLVLTDTYVETLRLLAAGRYDYALLAILPATYVIKDLGLTNIIPIAKIPEINMYSYATKKGNVELLSRFETGLAILKRTGQYKEIRDKWLGVLEPQGVSWVQLAKYGSIVLALMVGSLCIFIVWTRTLRKQVSERTAELAQEVKERKRAEEELRHNQEQLIQTSKMAALGTIVSGVAHEINNPNGLILLNVPILMKAHNDFLPIVESHYQKNGDFVAGGLRYSKLREELPNIHSEMLEASRRIKRIVEDLRDFGRIGSADLTESVDLNSAVRIAVRLVDNAIKKSTDHFVTELTDNLPRVRGNSQRIEQVIVNLVLNACQALPDRARGIFLSTWEDKDSRSVRLSVRDEGIGIPAEQIPLITDPFYTTKRDSGGTGLGLSVSAGIVKDHSGTLSFASAVGEGTTAVLSLPYEKS